MQGIVGCPVAAAGESVAGDFARGCRDGSHSAQRGQRGLVARPVHQVPLRRGVEPEVARCDSPRTTGVIPVDGRRATSSAITTAVLRRKPYGEVIRPASASVLACAGSYRAHNARPVPPVAAAATDRRHRRPQRIRCARWSRCPLRCRSCFDDVTTRVQPEIARNRRC